MGSSGAEPTGMAERVSEQARFAARAFVARWTRETGEELGEYLTDRMRFSHEMGYLRGHGRGLQAGAMECGERAPQEANDFVARWSVATGMMLGSCDADRMRFAHEMGYLRGLSEGLRVVVVLPDREELEHAKHE